MKGCTLTPLPQKVISGLGYGNLLRPAHAPAADKLASRRIGQHT
jgi:hypothetical protein